MFALSQFNVVETFAPSALPDFFAIPVSIPRSWFFTSLPFSGCFGILAAVRFRRKNPPIRLVRSLSQCVARCRRRPRGRDRSLVFSAIAPVACFSCEGFGLPIFGSFGANYRIQLLSLHLATSPPLLASDSGSSTILFPVGFPPTRQRTISRSTAATPPCPRRGVRFRFQRYSALVTSLRPCRR